MEKRHVQTFLMMSAAFFAMSLPVRQAQAGVVAAAVSRTLAQAGIGASPAEAWAASMGATPVAHTPFAARPIAHASRAHVAAVETASAKRDDAQAQADAAPFSLM
jgi:hypothetical protein